MEREKIEDFLVRAAYLAVWAALAAGALWCLCRLALPLLLGLALAYLLRPAVRFIARHSRMGEKRAAVVSVLALLGGGAALLWSLGTLLFLQIDDLLASLPEWYRGHIAPLLQQWNRWSAGWVRRISPGLGGSAGELLEQVETLADNAVAGLSATALEWAGRVLGSLPLLAVTLLFAVLSAILICADYEGTCGFLLRQIPRRLHRPLAGVRDFLAGSLWQMTKAYLLLAAVTFGVILAGLWILGFPGAWGIAALTALLDLLPLLGSGTALIPWGIWLLLTGRVYQGAGLLALWGASAFVRQLLEPKIVGEKLGLHPLAALASMYAGLRLAGFAGLLLGPVICLLLRHLKEQGLLRLYK